MSAITDYITENELTLNTGNLMEAVLVTGISPGDSDPVIRLRLDTELVDVPFLALITKSRGITDMKAGEIVLFTDQSIGDPEEYTIHRFDTTAEHEVGSLVMLNFFAEHLELSKLETAEATSELALLKTFMRYSFGMGDDALIRTTISPTTDGLLSGSSNTALVEAGYGFAGGTAVEVPAFTITYIGSGSEASTSTTASLLRPSGSHKRVDLVEVGTGGVVITKGVPDTTTYPAPSRTAGRLPIGTILVNSTGIVSVTDLREFF